MYALVNSICQTFLNASGTPYVVRAYKEKQIVKLTSYGSIITMLAAVIFNVIVSDDDGDKIATSAAGWSKLVLMIAIPATAIGRSAYDFCKRKIYC